MNRIFTITASRELTADTLLAWRYGTYSAEPFGRYIGLFTSVLPSLGRYAWIDQNDSTFAFEDVDTAQEIVAANVGEPGSLAEILSTMMLRLTLSYPFREMF